MLRLLTALAILGCSSAAHADIRATYSDGSVIEINDDGAYRGNLVSDGHTMLHVDGYNYVIVKDRAQQPVLDPAVVAQVSHAMTPDWVRHMMNEVPPLTVHFVRETTVGERSGMGYRVDDEAKISFVISDDPDLDLVGQVIAFQFAFWTDMQGPLGRLSAPLGEMFRTGAAIRFGNVDLVSVEEVPIDDARFALPSQPLGFEETRAVLVRTGLIKN